LVALAPDVIFSIGSVTVASLQQAAPFLAESTTTRWMRYRNS
jgi:hypothetical protein